VVINCLKQLNPVRTIHELPLPNPEIGNKSEKIKINWKIFERNLKRINKIIVCKNFPIYPKKSSKAGF